MTIRYSKNPSKNRKIAKLSDDGKQALWPYAFATYRKVGETCPTRCGFHPAHGEADDRRVHGQTCYAMKGRVPLHASKAARDEQDGDVVFSWVVERLPPGAVVRHHVSGDVYVDDVLDWEYFERLCEAHEARPDVKGWLYTHGELVDFLRMQERAPDNLAVNWSCDDLATAQQAQARGIRGVTAVVAPESDRERGLTLCPQQTSGIPCVECGLCMKGDRAAVVGFLAH